MADREKLTKKDFADKCVPYKALIREIDAQEKISYLKKELTLYGVFMLVFVYYVTSSSNIFNQFQMQRVVFTTLVEKRFPQSPDPDNLNYITYYEIDTKETYIQWLNSVVLPDLLVPARNASFGRVLDWNSLLWGIRFRQARVARNVGCELPEKIKLAGITDGFCTTEYSTTTRSIDPFGRATLVNVTGADGTVVTQEQFEYSWSDTEVTNAATFSGRIATYDGSGFLVDLPLNSTAEKLDALVEDLQTFYLDAQTRAVFMSLTLYNVNFNLFMLCGLTTLTNVLLVVFILFYCYKLVVKEPFWNSLDLVSIILFFPHLLFVVSVELFQTGQDELAAALSGNEYYAIDSLTNTYQSLREYYAINMVLVCVRIFKYLKLSKGLSMVWKTMSRAVRDIVYFMGLFVIMFFGFLLCGYLVYGPHIEDFNTIGFSASTLLRMLVGEIEYAPLRQTNPEFAWIFFSAYVFLFFFVLLNIFLAIILDAWNAEADAERKDTRQVDLWEEFINGVRQWWEVFRRRYRTRRYWNELARTVMNTVLNRKKEKQGFLSDEVVLSKLQEWKRKRQNKNFTFITITHLQQALEGVPKETEVPEDQLVSVFKRVERHLLPLEAAQRNEVDDENDEDDMARDMNMSELKKLQASFSLLADEQRRHLDTLAAKLDSLGELQQQTGSKLDYVDGQVRKIVPHFADE